MRYVISDLDVPQVKVSDKHGSFSSLASSDKSYSPSTSPRHGRKMLGKSVLVSLIVLVLCCM